METNQFTTRLAADKAYRREELYRLFSEEKEGLSGSSFRWILYELQQKEALFRKDYDAYVTIKPKILPVYRPLYTADSRTIIKYLDENCPSLSFVLFESVLLNEFLNHQIGQNTIYVQVEKEVSSYIFEILQEKYPGRVLYKPGKKEFDIYWKKNCIIILDLISQAPISAEAPHEITAEKLLVDLLADKSIAAIYSPAERSFIFENIMKNYRIDMRRLKRYAGRRGKKAEIEQYTGGLR